jgi:hypothetical protein
VVDLVVVVKVNLHNVEQRKEVVVVNNHQHIIHLMDQMEQVNQVLKNSYQSLFFSFFLTSKMNFLLESFVFVGLFLLMVKFVFVYVLFPMKLDNLIKPYLLKFLVQNEIIKYFVEVFVLFQQLVENLG